MNRGKKLKQMRRFINKYGVIDKEYDRPPDKTFPPYRKGSYYAHFIPYKDEIMEGLNNNYASISAPQDDTTVTFKKGGQITVAKIKEKIKNADRLQRAIFKQIDSLDKQIDRLSKAAFSKPNKPIRAK